MRRRWRTHQTGLFMLAPFTFLLVLASSTPVQNLTSGTALHSSAEASGGGWFTGFDDFTPPEPQFDAAERLEVCRELIGNASAPSSIISRKDPLFVMWIPPMGNNSYEHEWIEDVVLAKINRPVIYAYPEKCHLDLTYIGGLIPKHVLYILGAARAPDEFAQCMERVNGLRKKQHLMSEEAERAKARIGLIHLSDEHIGYGDLCPEDDSVDAPISLIRCDSRLVLMYPQFDYVLRNHWHPKLKMYGDKVRWFPLGHSTGYGRPAPNAIIPASMRKFRCSFRGARWENRRDFIAAAKSLADSGRLSCRTSWSTDFGRGLPITAFRKELMATVFAPTPPGLYNPDCFRIYEALYAGAIPIILRHFQFDPLGDHPIPMVNSWIEMGDVIERIEAEGVDAVQQRIYSWWSAYVAKMQDEVAVIVA